MISFTAHVELSPLNSLYIFLINWLYKKFYLILDLYYIKNIQKFPQLWKIQTIKFIK